jgi:membrane protein implicated in regulation of membrane protease activity
VTTLSGIDHLRGLVVAGSSAIAFDQSVGLVAQAVPALNDQFLMQLAEKGGGWAVLLVVLFFYRRDFLGRSAKENDTTERLYQAIARQSDVQVDHTKALTENTEVMRQAIRDQR